ncbi:MAG: exosortase E/protease, VPEID-CTERM system [Steroidobacteraceae bacterium]
MRTRSDTALQPYLPLLWRLAFAGALVVVEFVLRMVFRAGNPLALPLGVAGQSLYCFLMAWPATLVMLAVTDGSLATREAARKFSGRPLHLGWLALHLVLFVPIVWPQFLARIPVGIAWTDRATYYLPHALAPLALIALLRALAPWGKWKLLVQSTGPLQLRALLIAAAATLMIPVAQSMWEPATAVTVALVKAELLPFFPDLQVFPAQRILATGSLQVKVAEGCSGLEGVGLMLVFCLGWLWHLRREFRFPRALLIVPAAVIVVFLLNSVRISLLFAIAEMGFVEVAMAGFHSQAGWIFFLGVAFLVAIASRQMVWLQRTDPAPAAEPARKHSRVPPVAAFLLPLLAILAAGMLASAISTGFETFYSLRLLACVTVLLIYRRFYSTLRWRFSWRGIAGGILVFGVWIAAAHWLTEPAQMPAALGEMSPAMRGFWIATRVAAAAITVPVAEELAFRGFLMRRFVSADFSSIRLQDATPAALLLSSLLFGMTHGSFWAPGIAAGLVYGVLARYTGRIGEAVTAHATTNALLAVAVLCFDQWQLW